MTNAKRYALVGTGNRGLRMYGAPLSRDFPQIATLVALCDPNRRRLTAAASELAVEVPTFTDFDQMLKEANPDGVVVATMDCTHAQYIVAALRSGKRAISEKPLCTTAEQCRQIVRAAADSSATCQVTHNARYGAAHAAIQAILRSGRLGQVRFIQFDETLDRCHGADYFRRWHRHKANSGGLLIHKASHHFDLINWWAQAKPRRVSATGSLTFYGSNNPYHHPRCTGCPHAKQCNFYTDMFTNERYRKLYLEAEPDDGYFRDGCVWEPTIDIEDQMSLLIDYENDLQVSYTLLAYSPYESERVIIEGSEGRLEYFAGINTGWIVDSQPLPGIEEIASEQLKLYVPAQGIENVPIKRRDGGHGGADPQLRNDFFGQPWDAEPNDQMASLEEAVQAVLIGAAANQSIATGDPVDVQHLLVED